MTKEEITVDWDSISKNWEIKMGNERHATQLFRFDGSPEGKRRALRLARVIKIEMSKWDEEKGEKK